MTSSSSTAIKQYLQEIDEQISQKKFEQLTYYFKVELPYSELLGNVQNEVKALGTSRSTNDLEEKINTVIQKSRFSSDAFSCSSFTKFVIQYLSFLRDVGLDGLFITYDNTACTFEMFIELYNRCNSAFAYSSIGISLLSTVISLAKTLTKWTMRLYCVPNFLEKSAEHQLLNGRCEGLPERAADSLRQSFVTCLNDRTTKSSNSDTLPGRKPGVYVLANLCLKVLYKCWKTTSAEQIFTNIYNQESSPPLSAYPKSQRCTYLYYLGRFHFANNHFYRTHLALSESFRSCPKRYINQRRLILIYLIATNIILGRMPSEQLYRLPEAKGFRERFNPFCQAIITGDWALFKIITNIYHTYAPWFIHYRIFFQLKNRCEVLVWRSLVRQTFVIRGSQGDLEKRLAPTLSLQSVLLVAKCLEGKYFSRLNELQEEYTMETTIQLKDADSDFEGVESFQSNENDNSIESSTQSYNTTINNLSIPKFTPLDLHEIEGIVSSLIQQELINGYLSHEKSRLAIQGARLGGGALIAGFPNVWKTLKDKANDEVPGWRKELTFKTILENNGDHSVPSRFAPGIHLSAGEKQTGTSSR